MKEMKMFECRFANNRKYSPFWVPLNFEERHHHFDTSMQGNIEHLCSLSLQLQFNHIQQNKNLKIDEYEKVT
jgi:hypothetical protein